MGFLASKKVLVTGLLSNRSIAWGIARAMQREGANIVLTYQGEAVRGRVEKLAAEMGVAEIYPCDVAQDSDIEHLFDQLARQKEGLDSIIHSIAFAPREALAGNFHESVTRENFRIAHDISSYSFSAMAKFGAPLLAERQGSLLTLSYLGAERSVPNYNVMGLAKASLEANVRYLAQSLGPMGIRVNAISAGPIKTLAASGIGDFGKILGYVEQTAPLRRNVTIEEVGNVAAFLCSSLASGITGEIVHVDGGFSSTVPGMAGG
ncbi:MAG: SDR family oxidoreductase [Betaproteobacteria bacterium]|jgi:Enoyl-[acyl-carrier-protein] reductase [NADH] (EC 1.3.1.9)|nr:SDR family oxidoreductase [Betaproteobacteria bacterium]